jgi:hypothetical protein
VTAPFTTAAPLPPTPRDFEIFEQSQVIFLSTRHIADKHGISQTRVRQIVARVAAWLAAHLPARTEAQQEAEVRLAQHLAAAQLRRQIEVLRAHFDGTGDPKYLRHQTRVITALARLGIVPGGIDALAADYSDEPSASTSPTDHGPLTTNPLPGDCSPREHRLATGDADADAAPATTDEAVEASDQPTLSPDTQFQGLQIMERRLLTLLDQTSPDDKDRRSSLEGTLATIRRNLASLELRLSPHQPGVAITAVEPASTTSIKQPALPSQEYNPHVHSSSDNREPNQSNGQPCDPALADQIHVTPHNIAARAADLPLSTQYSVLSTSPSPRPRDSA